MINYSIKVTSSGEFIWGAESFNTDIVNEGSFDFVVKNSEDGELIELWKEPNVGGSGGIFSKLSPGETVGFSLNGCTGIKAVCTVEHADSKVHCFIVPSSR